MSDPVICKKCKGTGKRRRENCGWCKGSGKVIVEAQPDGRVTTTAAPVGR